MSESNGSVVTVRDSAGPPRGRFALVLLGVLVLAGVTAQIVRAFRSELVPPVALERLQLAAFPLLLLAASRLSIGRARIPLAVIACAAIAGISALASAYGFVTTDRPFIVARLEGDGSGSASRILRERINGLLESRGAGSSGVRLYRAVSSDEEALELIAAHPDTAALVWGSERSVRLTFPPAPPSEVAELGGDAASERIARLRLVRSIPGIALSRAPELGTVRFAGALLEGLLAGARDPESDTGDLALAEASMLVETWTSFSHRAYPLLLLGNSYVARGLRDGERGWFDCARAAYRRAFRYLRARDNPALYAALVNNTAVLTAIEGENRGKRRDARSVRKLFRRAAQMKIRGTAPGHESPALVARANLSVFGARDAARRGVVRRKKGKRAARVRPR